MKKVVMLSVVLLVCSFFSFAQEERRILVYTKNGEGYVHDNIEASVNALQNICSEHNIKVDVSENPVVFSPENLVKYKTVIFSNTNNEAFDNQAQREAFQHYIQGGGGFVGIHSACGSERDWPWYWAMVGGKFVRHPPLQPFDIKVIDFDHPSTSFLGKIWKWEDECYYLNQLNPDIHILLAVDLTTINDKQMDEYPGQTFGTLFPLAWYHYFDGGREFYTALGHKIEHYSDPQFLKHLEGGILWAMGEKKN